MSVILATLLTFSASPQQDFGLMMEELLPVGGAEQLHFLFRKPRPQSIWGYGECVDAVGDVDGDGVDDFAIQDTDYQPTEVSVYSGSSGVRLFGLEGDYFAGVGDIDGDGLAEIVTRTYPTSTLYSGATQQVLFTIPAYGVPAPGGDLNCDGVLDILVATYRSIGGSWTEAYSGADGSFIRSFEGGRSLLFYEGGESSAVLGDLNGDGCDDLIVSNRSATNSAGDREAGVAVVYSGKDASVLFEYEGESHSAELGISVSALPDFDGDGLTDFMIGEADGARANGWRQPNVRAYSGADGRLLFVLNGKPGSRFGGAIDTVPDIDGDGVDEILVGAPWYSEIPWSWRQDVRMGMEGAAFLYSGSSLEELHVIERVGKMNFAMTGHSVHGMNDTNGDGRGEFIVGAYGFDYFGWPRGASIRAMSFNPQLFLSDREVSAAVGGTIGIELDFSDEPIAASQPYKVLMSGLRGSQTDHLGIGVPLARDGLFERTYQGVYPFPRSGPMHGVLDANGKRSFQLNFAPGQLSSAIGLTYSFAAVIEPVAGQAIASSSATTLQILP